MTLPSTPPRYAGWAELVAPIRPGETGWRAFALQKAVNSVRQAAIEAGQIGGWKRLEPDGIFGPATGTALKAFQLAGGLTADAIAGAVTQGALLSHLGHRTHELAPALPDGLMRGFAEAEGANVLAATNWSVPGGVDCGPMQIRVPGPPYDAKRMQGAFDPLNAMLQSATTLLGRATTFNTAAWVSKQGRRRKEWSLRLAALAHNWPAGAAAIARDGSVPHPTERATWAPASAKFPDGTPVRTHAEWCQFYALGGPHGEGSVTKYVSSWA